jgi:transposase
VVGSDRDPGCWENRQNQWTFVEVEGVEPTNNAAEQALRQVVIWRKLSFGTQSAEGSRFVERLLTVVETCRRQQRNVFSWLVDAVEARFTGKCAPSLLSGT